MKIIIFSTIGIFYFVQIIVMFVKLEEEEYSSKLEMFSELIPGYLYLRVTKNIREKFINL